MPHTRSSEPLRAIIVEDMEDDVTLLVDELVRAGFDVTWLRTETGEGLQEALTQDCWDIVFSDFTLPRFRGDHALRLVRAHDPDLPFIFVSGTIGEEAAVTAIQEGAQDYVMKGRLLRLPSAVQRCLEVARTRRERRQAEDALRKLSQVVEQAADSVFITDRDGRIEYVNPAFERMTGYMAREVIGATPDIFSTEWSTLQALISTWQPQQEKQLFRGTIINRRKNGEEFHEEKTISPLTNALGITHFVSTGRDVTERVVAEEVRNRLTAILEATIDFVAIANADGRLLYLNRTGRQMMGMSNSMLEGKYLWDAMTEWGAQRLKTEALPRASTTGAWHGECALRTDEDTGTAVSLVLLAHYSDDGKVTFFSVIARDITESKRFEEELSHKATHDALNNLTNR